MSDENIPSGKDVGQSQADGSAPSPKKEEPPPEADQIFRASAVWAGDGTGSGELRTGEKGMVTAIAGSRDLGGSGGATNPEELLMGAIAACFVNTWAIFLKKLQIAYEEPAVRTTGTLGKDPAGGFRMTGVTIHARVPEPLLAADRARVEKSLSLAEKYCIISKVARAALPLKVEIEAV